jgi:hypothetical protein
METIGLDFNALSELQRKTYATVLDSLEEATQISFANHIKRGCNTDEASFRAEITTIITATATSILGTIVGNNNRILYQLREAGLISD